MLYALIQPQFKYLAISEDNVFSIYINDAELNKCIDMQEYIICSNTQTHYVQETNNCENKLLINQDNEIPKICDIKMIQINKLILHKLKKENVWLFTTQQPVSINISCDNGEPIQQILNSTGTISLTDPCQTTTKEYELVPTKQI